jgi:prolipoprotein diacylglyceryl transferase
MEENTSSHFIWDFNPEIFNFNLNLGFSDFTIAPRWYGLCFATGILLGYHIMRRFYLKEGRSEEELNSGFVLFVIGTIVGARLGHCLFYEPGYYLSQPWKILFIWEGGLASHGGTIGIIACMLYYTRKYQIPFIWLADRLSVAIPLGVPFIRIGNFFNSEIYGLPTEVPWAIIFKHADELPRHPSQLYEALAYFALFFVQVSLYRWRGKSLQPGRMIGLMFIWIFTARFFIEFGKVEQVDFERGMSLNMGQLLSLPMIALGLFFFFGGYQKLGLHWGEGGAPNSAKQTTGTGKTKTKHKNQTDKKKRNH